MPFNSQFVDPFGGKNLSTAYDMARIMLNASGYDRLYDIWNTPEHTLRLIQPNGEIRESVVRSTVVRGSRSHVPGDAYPVMGGKTGTLLHPDVSNLVCICQSKTHPDDWYIIAALKAETLDSGERHRFQAVKEVMDWIEAGYDCGYQPDALDDIAWEGLSYRDIFVRNNLAPKINQASRRGQLGAYSEKAGSPQIVADDTPGGNYVPPYSLKCFGDGSQQLMSPAAYGDYPYFVAANVKIERYVSGFCGIMLAKNFDGCCSAVTDGWEVSAAILPDRDGHGGLAATRVFVGSGKQADLDGYVNNPVVVSMNLFKNPPSEEEMTALYRAYTDRLTAMGDAGQNGRPTVCAEHVYAIKKPAHTPRAFRYLDVASAYEKNPHTPVKPASTTKILTSLLLLDYVPDLQEKVVITQADLDAVKLKSVLPLAAGEAMTYLDLLYAMYLPSSNEACCVVARAVGERILRSRTP